MTKAVVALLPNDSVKLLWERLSVKGIVPEGDWLNRTIKVTVKWNDQISLKQMYNIKSTFRIYIIELKRKLPVPDVFGCLHQSKMQ